MEPPVGSETGTGRWYHPPARLLVRQRIAMLRDVARTIADVESEGPSPAAKAYRMLEHAERVLDQRWRLSAILRRSDIAALAAVDAAEMELVRAGSQEHRLATLSAVVHRARIELPTDDGARVRLAGLITGVPPGGTDLLAAMTTALREAAERRRRALSRMGALTRKMLAAAVVGAFLAIGLAAFGAHWPGAWPTCFRPGAGPVCPTGPAASGADLTLIELAGLVGAFITALATARPLRDIVLPDRLATLAMALKLSVGALLAPLGLLAIAGQAVPGLSALDSQRQIYGWSMAIGAGQQVFTAALDRRLVQLGLRTSRWYESVLPNAVPAGGQVPLPTHRPLIVHRYRLLCVAVASIGLTAAFVPLGLALGTPWPPVAGACAVLVVAFQGVRRTPPRRVPTGRGPFLRSVGATAAGFASIAGLIVLLGDRVALALTGEGRMTYVAVALAVVLGVVLGADIQAEVGRRLLGGPAHPGPVVFLRLAKPWVVGGLAVAAAVSIAGTTGASAPTWVAFGLLAATCLATGGRWPARTATVSPFKDMREIRDELVRALGQDGWKVLADPQLGSPRVDPLLRRVDLLLRQQEQALAVQIHTAGPDERQTGWREASELLVATNALEQLMERSSVDISPVMVLLDTEPDLSLRGLAEDRALHLLEIRPEAGRRLSDQLREKLTGLRRTTPAHQG